jgi:hypothetical protein
MATTKPDLLEKSYDASVPAIWETIGTIGAKVPDSEWAKVPRDLASNFDRYAHGAHDISLLQESR